MTRVKNINTVASSKFPDSQQMYRLMVCRNWSSPFCQTQNFNLLVIKKRKLFSVSQYVIAQCYKLLTILYFVMPEYPPICTKSCNIQYIFAILKMVQVLVLILGKLGKLFSKLHIRIFFLFPPETGFDILCKLFQIYTICMKCLMLFPVKIYLP